MQTAKVIVDLAGNRNQQVVKDDVTPAEYNLLMNIHKKGVKILERGEEIKIEGDALFEKLSFTYPKYSSLLSTLYPGIIKKFPSSFKEVGVVFEDEAKAPKPKSSNKSKLEEEII